MPGTLYPAVGEQEEFGMRVLGLTWIAAFIFNKTSTVS
jgi:hypothetical protein